jgi:membrane protease YdiL (CAAX protease family)
MTGAPDRPVWGWLDAAFFVGLLLPAVALALLVVKGVFSIVPAPNKASYLLGMEFLALGFWLTALFLLLKFRYDLDFWPAMAWRIPWPGAVSTWAWGPLLAMLVGLGAVVLRTPDNGSELQALMNDRLAIILVGLASATVGPLCEELVFRGFFQPLLVAQFGRNLGIVLCAAPFALLHGPQYHWTWQIVLLLMVAGAAFGYIRHSKNSTAASTLVHATYNLTYFIAYLINKEGNF